MCNGYFAMSKMCVRLLYQYRSVPLINGRPLTEYPGLSDLSPSVMDAIGAGPVGKNIFVRNLDYKVDEDKIKEVFGLAGTVEEVSLTKDQDGKSRGMGVVSFSQVRVLFSIQKVKLFILFYELSRIS